MPNYNKKLCLATKLRFGKYKNSGKNIYELIYEDSDYVIWIVNIWEGLVDDRVVKLLRFVLDKKGINKRTLN